MSPGFSRTRSPLLKNVHELGAPRAFRPSRSPDLTGTLTMKVVSPAVSVWGGGVSHSRPDGNADDEGVEPGGQRVGRRVPDHLEDVGIHRATEGLQGVGRARTE